MAQYPGSIADIALTSDGNEFVNDSTKITSAYNGSGDSQYVWFRAVSSFTYDGKTYKFSRWSFTGTVPSWAGRVTDTYIQSLTRGEHDSEGSQLIATANYVIDDGGESGETMYTVRTAASPKSGGAAAIVGYGTAAKVAEGTSLTIVATANQGYKFKFWLDESGSKITDSQTDVTVNSDKYYLAFFRKVTNLIVRKG